MQDYQFDILHSFRLSFSGREIAAEWLQSDSTMGPHLVPDDAAESAVRRQLRIFHAQPPQIVMSPLSGANEPFTLQAEYVAVALPADSEVSNNTPASARAYRNQADLRRWFEAVERANPKLAASLRDQFPSALAPPRSQVCGPPLAGVTELPRRR